MNEITNFETSYLSSAGNEIKLSIALARQALNIDNKVSDVEVFTFLKLCQHQKLDPFLGEVHFIYVGGRVQKVVGVDTFTNRLNEHPLCLGWGAGLLIESEGKIVEQKGTFHLPTQKIVGAWFSVKRKGWEQDFYWSISFKEYYREYYDKDSKTYKPMGQWGSMPATMIVKCAITSGCRKAFPKSFTGLYSPEEFGENSEATNSIDVKYEEVNEFINEEQIKVLYDTAKSEIIEIDSEKLISYVIEQMIKQKILKENTTIKTIPFSKLNKLIEWVKISVELKEKKNKKEVKADEKAGT